MSRQDTAKELHHQGLNCAQSVLLANADYTGLDRGIATKVSCGFGGGVRSGEICGCISGAVMALGCRGSQVETADLAREAVAAFREEHEFVRCADLQEKYGGKTKCDDMIAFAADMTARIMEEHDFSPIES